MSNVLNISNTHYEGVYLIQPYSDNQPPRPEHIPILLGTRLATIMVMKGRKPKNFRSRVPVKLDHSAGGTITGVEKVGDPWDLLGNINEDYHPDTREIFQAVDESWSFQVGPSSEKERDADATALVMRNVSVQKPTLYIGRKNIEKIYPELASAPADPFWAKKNEKKMVLIEDDFTMLMEKVRAQLTETIDFKLLGK